MPKVVCHDLKGKEYEVDSDELIFRPSVYGIIIKDNKVLLSKQFKDGYDFPGGGIEKNETVIEALKREVWEETGIEVEENELVHCQTSFYKSLERGYWNSVLIFYTCTDVGGKLSMDNFDDLEKEYADMPEWVDLDKIDKIKFYNSVDSVALIKKALELKK